MKTKPLVSFFLWMVVSSVLNIAIFVLAYRQLVFPFLHEEQRVDNAPFIFIYVMPGFVLVSLITFVLFLFLMKSGPND